MDDNAGNTVYHDFPEANTGKTTWQPGPLAPLSDYEFSVTNARLTGGSVLRLQTAKQDLFNYYGGNGQTNTADFTTLPEPATLALVGTAVLGLIGWRRRRSLK